MNAIGRDPVRSRLWSIYRLVPLGLVIVVAGLLSGGADMTASSSGLAPPVIAANAATGWPAHNYALSHSRADLSTDINATNVATLKQKWTFELSYTAGGPFGEFASNPIVVDGDVYFENTDSGVFALNEDSGKLVWEHKYHSAWPSGGPNGVAVG